MAFRTVSQRGLLVAGLILVLLLGAGAAGAGAQTPSGLPQGDRELPEPLDLDAGGDDVPAPTLVPRLTDADRRITVMLRMQGAPVAVAQAEARERGVAMQTDERRTLRRALSAQQDAIADELARLDATVLAQLQDAYNGIRVHTPAGNLRALAALPGVRAVEPVATHRPTNATSVPFLDVPAQVWAGLDLTGEGVSIGIIDTGIDYTHAAFGGPGTEDAYEGNDPAVVEGGSFPTAKVIGGHDFVGDRYDASGEGSLEQIPNPDPDPLDCHGHGSHVAGTAAGQGVTADGATYTGPYGPGAYAGDAPAFRVGPGVAPQADLYALKVFGCEGSTNATIDAVDWAVANDLDVLNLSLGSPFGTSDDPLATALDNAVAAGTVVVASAGNSGIGPFITGAPATGAGVISVAAVDSIATLDVADLLVDGAVAVPALQNSNGADVTEPVTGELVVLEDDSGTPDEDESLGCTEEDFADVGEGDVVVTFRATCDRVTRAVLGQAAGVEAVVFVNNAPGPPPVEGVIPGVDIPFLGATPEQGGQLVELAGRQVTVVDAGELPNPQFRRPAGFTSGGPRLDDNGLKPDVAAPGVGIDSALFGSGTRATRISGTSMASPHVAGVAALQRQALSDADVAELKARLVNTADPNGVVDYATVRVGAGLVDPDQALTADAVAYGGQAAVALNFGYVGTGGGFSRSRPLRVRNTGDASVTYRFTAEPSSDADGTADVQVLPGGVAVPPGATRTVQVRITVDVPGQAVGSAFRTVSGTVALTPVAGVDRQTLRVPYLLVPDATSRIDVAPGAVRLPAEPTTLEVTAANASPVPGGVDTFAWGIADGSDDPPLPAASDLRTVGVQAFPAQDPFPRDPSRGGVGVFAFGMDGRMTQPAVHEFDVLLDVDEDGTHDFAVVGVDSGAVLSGGFNGQLAAFAVDLRPGADGEPRNTVVSAFLADAGFNTSVVRLPFVLSDVGLTADANPDFTYVAATYDLVDPVDEDVAIGEGAFDAYDRPIQTGQSGVLPGGATARIPVAVDPEDVVETPVLGWMFVLPDNPPGAQVDIVRLVGVPRRP